MDAFGAAVVVYVVVVVVLALGDVFVVIFDVNPVEGPVGKLTPLQCFPYVCLFLVKRLWHAAKSPCPVY